MKWINKLKNLFKSNSSKVYTANELDLEARHKYIENIKLEKNLEKNIQNIKELYGNSFDLNIRRFKIGKNNIKCALVYMTGAVSTSSIEEILDKLEIELLQREYILKENKINLDLIIDNVLNNKYIEKTNQLIKILNNISLGTSVILIDGFAETILCETKGPETRSIEEPTNEISIRGPRDGFVENIYTNISLLRKRIRTPHLWLENFEIGDLTKTEIAIAYIKGLASEELIEEVRSRLQKIDIESVLESGYLQEFLKDEPYTLFPLIERTERPDKVISCLTEGRVAILTNNTPFVLVVPTKYNMLLQTPDDYYEDFHIGSLIRILRHLAFIISILLPGSYVAIVNFHPELLPVGLLLRIASSREGVPFPVIVESLLMESIFEILREAGIRLPQAIGPAISIVGALVLGEAAINAGLVSPPMVIIVALTAIASFTTPDYTLANTGRMLRYIFIFLGGTLGLFGIQYGFLLTTIHMCSLRSFGQPYFSPFAPLVWSDLKDSIIRLFAWKQTTRPKLLGGREPKKKEKNQKPKNPGEEEESEGKK